ncbi:GNAT family N-acetyltransferase [cf. Phormidesmis sp. LEGE 11477]|uniref:GNAT family N-acetyltransferase n=1 Tax=cf. Phormidesmis sp. LEGE 11477 TaxID=1828680 RepID=UPI0018828D8E|nr:GNAT family N-acetyltransferase [cf. Phormidesmis sp. LEGE 11477]MBE9063794.1 GNAT family N-acetyltransferase [cf. Phormidesmis sp. LEGE 11477]
MLTTRLATAADVSFLAHVVYEALLSSEKRCFWDDLLEGIPTETEAFLAAMLTTKATHCQIDDFLIVERDEQLVAAACIYAATQEDYRPLRLEQMDKLAKALGWPVQTKTEFCDRYFQVLGHDPKPTFLKPQAPWIIEYVAVVAEARGQGVGKFLLRSLLEQARQKDQLHVGIMVVNANDRAYKAYESVGFRPYETTYSSYFLNNFGFEFSGFTKFGQILTPVV